MSEKSNVRRSYQVLALAIVEPGPNELDRAPMHCYVACGIVDAPDADKAIQLAVELSGLPADPSGRVIAVPISNWNERQVEIRQQPVVDVGPVEGAQATLEGTGEPEGGQGA